MTDDGRGIERREKERERKRLKNRNRQAAKRAKRRLDRRREEDIQQAKKDAERRDRRREEDIQRAQREAERRQEETRKAAEKQQSSSKRATAQRSPQSYPKVVADSEYDYLKDGRDGLARSPDGLIFLPKGDAYRTRSARKQGLLQGLTVYDFFLRGRSSRIGLLVPPEVVEVVEEMAEETERVRAKKVQAKDDLERSKAKKTFVEIFPSAPKSEIDDIISRSFMKRSRRVGRSTKLTLKSKINLAVSAHVRHHHTDYEQILRSRRRQCGTMTKADIARTRSEARNLCGIQVHSTMDRWRRDPRRQNMSVPQPALTKEAVGLLDLVSPEEYSREENITSLPVNNLPPSDRWSPSVVELSDTE